MPELQKNSEVRSRQLIFQCVAGALLSTPMPPPFLLAACLRRS